MLTTKDILKKVRELDIKSKKLTTNLFTGEYHSAFKGKGMSFKEVREYAPGDDIRFIDWNVSARFGHPYSKLFEEERELTVMLLIDISASSLFGTLHATKKDIITELAAVLGFSAVNNGDKLGVIFYSDTVEKYIPPKKGRQNALYIVREMLTQQSDHKSTQLSSALRFFRNMTKQRSIAFILSDFLDANYEDALRVTGNKHDVIGIKIYDKMDMELPDAGLWQIEDSESGNTKWIDTGSENVRDAYQEEFFRVTAYSNDVFRKAGCDLLHLRTDQDYVRVLQRFLKAVPENLIMQCFYKLLFTLFVLLCGVTGITQDSLTMSATVDRQQILIGEPITLTLDVTIPSQQPIRFFQIDSLPHFEVLDLGKIDTADNRNAVRMMQRIKIASFDSGSWKIPELTMAGTDLITDSIPIEVAYSKPFDPNQEYHDIKDILDIPPAREKPWYRQYAWVGVILLALIIVIVWLRMRKKPEKKIVSAPLEKDPYSEAIEALNQLKPENHDAKIFHSSVVEIFRLYLKKAKGIQSLSQTTDDLVRQLRSLSMPEERYTAIADALRTTDLVKFAKYQPEPEDNHFVLKTVRESIEYIHKTTRIERPKTMQ